MATERAKERRGNKYAHSEEGSVVRAPTVEEVERANRAAHSLVPRSPFCSERRGKLIMGNGAAAAAAAATLTLHRAI